MARAFLMKPGIRKPYLDESQIRQYLKLGKTIAKENPEAEWSLGQDVDDPLLSGHVAYYFVDIALVPSEVMAKLQADGTIKILRRIGGDIWGLPIEDAHYQIRESGDTRMDSGKPFDISINEA